MGRGKQLLGMGRGKLQKTKSFFFPSERVSMSETVSMPDIVSMFEIVPTLRLE